MSEIKKNASTRPLGYEALLLLVTFLWGTTFVAQSLAMKEMPPYAFIFARFLISAVILLVITLCRDGIRKYRSSSAHGFPDKVTRINDSAEENDLVKARDSEEAKRRWKRTILGGVVTGITLFAASAAQQYGLMTTTVGEASFITTFYIILVPVFRMLFGKRPSKGLWIGVVIALTGLYLISVEQGFSISIGNAYVLLSALLFSFQILSIDAFSKDSDLMWYAVIEFFVIAAISLVFTLALEEVSFEQYRRAGFSILYAAIVSGAFCYTMQNVCQKHLDPTLASLIMGSEAVFATLSGYVILREALTARKLIGCALVLVAVTIAQLSGRRQG